MVRNFFIFEYQRTYNLTSLNTNARIRAMNCLENPRMRLEGGVGGCKGFYSQFFIQATLNAMILE